MGSWTDLDATYPPDKLTPAAAFAVAHGHLAGAASVYAGGGRLADFLPRPGIVYDLDVLTRAERYLREVPVEEFLAEARRLLNRRQRLCLALNLLDRALAGAPGRRAFLAQALEALEVPPEDLEPHRRTLEIKSDLSIFPQ